MKILAGIFLLGFILRFFFFDITPPGFNADEAALGYNAYSLLQTSKDEWEASLPFVFRSFSDYKPGLYVYLALPFVAVFGPSELAVRLPSILLGVFSIVLIYFLAKELFKKETAALACAFLLSVSPWHIHFSRGAWEANVATFFILAGVLSFVKSFHKQSFLWISVLAFVASMYAYQSARLVAPILVFLLMIFYWRKLLIKKNIPIAVSAFILLLPLIFILPSNAGMARFKGVSIFSDLGPINRVNEERGQHQNPGSFSAKFFHNKIEVYAENFIGHYLDHFSPDFLFLSGGPLKRNKIPDMGQMHIFETVTLVLGFYFLSRYKFANTKIVFLWLIVAPLASSLTFQTPDSHRSHNMVVPLVLVSGLGLGLLWEKFLHLSKYKKHFFQCLTVLIIFVSVSVFLERIYVHLPKQYALEWEYGFSQMIPYVVQNQDKYQKIVMTDRYDQPYILFLFYSRYDPAKYQKEYKVIGDNKYGFTTISSFSKYEFRPIGKEEISNSKNTLFIGTENEISADGNLLKVINFPDGKPAFKIIGT